MYRQSLASLAMRGSKLKSLYTVVQNNAAARSGHSYPNRLCILKCSFGYNLDLAMIAYVNQEQVKTWQVVARPGFTKPGEVDVDLRVREQFR